MFVDERNEFMATCHALFLLLPHPQKSREYRTLKQAGDEREITNEKKSQNYLKTKLSQIMERCHVHCRKWSVMLQIH
jgi:hypothetical protein